jgi:protein-disulfide isomerase
MKTKQKLLVGMMAVAFISACSKKEKAVEGVDTAVKKEQSVFQKEQVAAIETIVHQYLVNNPAVVAESIMNLQKQAMDAQQSKVLELLNANKADLEHDSGLPVLGAGKTRFVAFIDYADPASKEFLSVLKTTVAQDKDVKVVLRFIPDTSSKSQKMARIAMAAFEMGVFDAVHERLIAVPENATESEILDAVGTVAGVDRSKLENLLDTSTVKEMLAKNRTLSEKLSIVQSPAFVVGEFLLKQAVTAEQMKMLLENLRAQKK